MAQVIQSPQRRFRWLLIVLTAGLTGCGHLPSVVHVGPLKASAPVGVAKPAHIERTAAKTSIPLPSGSSVEIQPSGARKITLAAASAVETDTTTEKADTATGYAPPSPIEKARAAGVRYFWIASLVSFLAAGLLAWRTHFLAAVCAAGAGIALPVLANFVNSQAAMITGGALMAAGLALFVGWHIENAKKTGPPSPAQPVKAAP